MRNYSLYYTEGKLLFKGNFLLGIGYSNDIESNIVSRDEDNVNPALGTNS
jgi:hypothetical protein